MAIDVNSGNFRADDSAEETAYQMNQLAAKEIARQLRLRDLGGVIVNDFIDMRKERHRRNVERALREAMKRDRARTKILRTSPFGLIEMTRQRIRPSLKRSVYKDCPCCTGTGVVKTAESMAIEVVRVLMFAAQREGVVPRVGHRGRRGGQLPAQQKTARNRPAGRPRQHDHPGLRQGRGLSRAFGNGVPRRRGPGNQAANGHGRLDRQLKIG